MIKRDTKFLDKYSYDFKKLINFNLKAYSYIKNIHQFWLLSLVNLVIGEKNYLPK